MFARTSEFVTQQLEKENAITAENRELYMYGIQNGLVIALNLLTSLIIGLIFGELIFSLLLLAVYIPVRTYAGGYHASTQIRCYIVSSMIMAAWLSILKWVKIPTSCCVIAFLICLVICLCLSPVDSENKRFDETEKKVFGKRARVLILICSGIWLSALIADILIAVKIITIAICTVSIMLIIGFIDNNKNYKESN